MNEHENDILTKKESVVSIHCNTKKHVMNFDDVKICDRVNVWNIRLLSEMLHIHIEKSPLNKKSDTQFLSKCYKQVLNSIR